MVNITTLETLTIIERMQLVYNLPKLTGIINTVLIILFIILLISAVGLFIETIKHNKER